MLPGEWPGLGTGPHTSFYRSNTLWGLVPRPGHFLEGPDNRKKTVRFLSGISKETAVKMEPFKKGDGSIART